MDVAIVGGWLVLDQLTKFMASVYLFSEPVTVIPGFLRFALSHNRGALFGWMGNLDEPWRTVLLTGLPILAIFGLAALLVRTADREVFARVGLALILGGAIGNVLDRIFYHHVIDFIDVYTNWKPLAERLVERFGTNRWPTFNIADTGLVCGVLCLLFEVFARPHPKAKETAGVSVPE